MTIKATKLRQNIYKVLDHAVQTGQVIEIERKGQIIKLVPPKKNKLENLKKRKITTEKADAYVHNDWSKEWQYKNDF